MRPATDTETGLVAETDEGASAVEYGLLVAGIVAIMMLLVFALGGYVKGAFQQTCDKFDQAGISAVTNGSSTTCSQ